MLVRAVISVVGLLLSGLHARAEGAEPMPPGISIRMTIAGPAFVDAQGMTLYQKVGQTPHPCTNRPETVRPLSNLNYNAVEEFPMQVPDAVSRRSCAEKYPPLLAAAGAKPVVHWTLQQRENGSMQWAYRGRPLHRSIKDKAPGDIHGWGPPDKGIQMTGWGIATAPLKAPSGVEARLTSLGLALANHEGKPLYYQVTKRKVVSSASWKPVLAPAVTMPNHRSGDWSITSADGGLRQWAWQGKPLYTYAKDDGDAKPSDISRFQFVSVFGDVYGKPVVGWQLALLKAASAPPAGLRIKSAYPRMGRTNKIYADAQGKTVYAIHCAEFTEDRLDCDDVGDSPRYWLSFCGGQERCLRDWKPVAARKDARPIDGLWSVAVINPAHPFKPLEKGEAGLAVLTHRGRLVFTYAEDQGPDDINGQFDYVSTVMSALPIYTFETP